jgi:hypothetical protein
MPDYALQATTQHYRFSFDIDLLPAGAPNLCNALALSAETDYSTLSSWFANKQFDPIDVYADVGTNGATNTSSPFRKINFDAGPFQPSGNLQVPDFCRMMLNSEADELFMDEFGFWERGNSTGEGLSRALAETISPNSIMKFQGQSPAAVWLNASRPNWINLSEGTDQNYESIGCAVLFLNFLRFQLGRRWEEIIKSAQSFPGVFPLSLSLDFVFHWLTQPSAPWLGPNGLAWLQFINFINANFPPGKLVSLPNNNPFPILAPATWKPWHSIGAPPPKLLKPATPAVSSYLSGIVDCFALGTDKAVWHNQFDGSSWGGWKNRAGNFTGGVAAVAMSPYQVLFFAIAADGSLQRNRVITSGFFEVVSGWKVINPGKAVGVPTAVSWAPYRVDCFARSPQGTILHCHSEDEDANYTAWQDLGNPGGGVTVVGSPAAISLRPDSLDCFVRCSDQSLHRLTWSGFGWSWSQWPGTGSPVKVLGDPAVVARPPNLIDVFVEVSTTAKDIVQFSFNPGRGSWQPTGVGHPGDMLNDGPPSAVSSAPDRFDLVVIASDNTETNVWTRLSTVP